MSGEVLHVIGGFLAIIFLSVVVSIRDDERSRQIWEEYDMTHPPISDGQFLDRLSPDVSPEIALHVRKLVAEVYGIDYEQVYPDTNLFKLDCGMWPAR